MAIVWQTPYGVLNSTGNAPTGLSPAYAAGTVTGDVTLIVVGMKPSVANSGTLTTPNGFTLIGSITGATDGNTGGYGTTLGADTGNMNLYVLAEVADTNKSGIINLVMANASSAYCYVARLSNATGLWSFATTTGKDTTAGNVSVTFGSNPGVTAGDFLLAAFAIPTDVTTPAQFSAHSITQTGVTFGTITEVLEFDNAGGNDSGGYMLTTTASSGTASAAPVMTATAGGTTTNVRGPAIFVRLREQADTQAPTLTSPTGIATGSTTATGTVNTDEANGTLYYLATTNATESVATVKTGSSQAISSTGTKNVSVTGLTASTIYYLHYVHTDAANNDSIRVSSASFTTNDGVAPTLTSPTGTATGSTTASGTVNTDEANGTLYYLATTNATESVATVKAGSSQAVSAIGVQNVSFTGLTSNTVYYAHYVHTDAALNDSVRVTSAQFTTYFAPVINTQPTNQTASVGSTATFTVAATGNPSVTYQWQNNTGTEQFYDDFVGTAGENLTTRGFTKLGLGDSRAALDGAGGLRAQSGGNEAVVAVDTGSADHFVEVVLGANFASTDRARQCIQLRTQDRNNYYAAGYSSAEGLWELWDFNSRSGTYAAAAPVAGTVLRVEISSAGIVLKLNGTTVLSNSALTSRNTFTHAGLYMGAAVDTNDVIRDVKIGALFAPLASDTFTGIGNALLGGRVMNNALGGSGTYTWASISDNFTGNGADAIITSSAGQPALVSVPGVTTARMRFDPNGGTSNVSLQILRNNGGPLTGLLFLLAASHTSLRVSSFTSDVRTDHATLGITAPGAPFWMEIEVVGLKVTCRILNDNLTTRNTVSHTFTGNLPVGGDFCGPAFFQDGSTGIFDSLILRSEPVGWSDISGATLLSFTTPILTIDDDGVQYRVKVSNSQGFVYSNAATLTVNSIVSIKYWNGSAWINKPLKQWTGSAWVEKPLKYWNGSAWV